MEVIHPKRLGENTALYIGHQVLMNFSEYTSASLLNKKHFYKMFQLRQKL